jgi:hypothetical protein
MAVSPPLERCPAVGLLISSATRPATIVAPGSVRFPAFALNSLRLKCRALLRFWRRLIKGFRQEQILFGAFPKPQTNLGVASGGGVGDHLVGQLPVVARVHSRRPCPTANERVRQKVPVITYFQTLTSGPWFVRIRTQKLRGRDCIRANGPPRSPSARTQTLRKPSTTTKSETRVGLLLDRPMTTRDHPCDLEQRYFSLAIAFPSRDPNIRLGCWIPREAE